MSLRNDPALMLVAMPWNMPDVTSIQVGCLKSFIGAQGWTVHARHYYKDVTAYVGVDITRAVLDYALGEFLFGAVLYPERHQIFQDYVRTRVPTFPFTKCVQALTTFLQDVVADLMQVPFDVIGLTTTHVQLSASLCVANRLKQINQEMKVVLGGLSLYGVVAEELLDLFPCVDYIVVGEGERPLQRLMESTASRIPIEAVPQLIFRKDGKVTTNPHTDTLESLDTVPSPDYSDYTKHHLRLQVPSYPRICIETSRGCRWGKCSFCIEGLPSRGGYRTKSPVTVADEVRELTKKHRTLDVIFADPDLASRTEAFNELAATGLQLRMAAEVSGMVSKDTLLTMRKAGLDVIQIGVESLSPRMLKKFAKGVPLMKYVELLKWCDELGLTLVYNLITGAPFETQEDVDCAVRNMDYLMTFQAPILSHFVVSVGSRILKFPAEYNISRIRPADEALCYPEQIAARIGPLLSFHAGYGFEAATKHHVDYAMFLEKIDQWKLLREARATLSARMGDEFVDVQLRVGEEVRHVIIEDPLEAKIYYACASRAKSLRQLADQFPGTSRDLIMKAANKFRDARIMFVLDESFLSLASFGPGKEFADVESVPAFPPLVSVQGV